MDLLRKEWMEMKREMVGLKQDNMRLSNKVSEMTATNEELNAVRRECLDVRAQNVQILLRLDRLEVELGDGKRTVVSTHTPATDPTADSGANVTSTSELTLTLLPSPIPVTSSACPDTNTSSSSSPSYTGANTSSLSSTSYPGVIASSPSFPTAPPPSYPETIASSSSSSSSKNVAPKPLTPKEEKVLLKEAFRFNVSTSDLRPIINKAGDSKKVNNYDKVYTACIFMDETTGVYRTPVEGRFQFKFTKYLMGKGGADWCFCGSDGRRELVSSSLCSYTVSWDCPKGLRVWVDLEPWTTTDCAGTTILTQSEGWLE